MPDNKNKKTNEPAADKKNGAPANRNIAEITVDSTSKPKKSKKKYE